MKRLFESTPGPTMLVWAAILLAFRADPSAVADDAVATGGQSPIQAAVARASDGTYLYLTAEDGNLQLRLGTPAADSLDVELDRPTTLVGADGLVQSGPAQPAATIEVTADDLLLVAWSSKGQAYLSSCPLRGEGRRARSRENYSEPIRLGAGHPTDSALDPRGGTPVFTGFCDGTIWVARKRDNAWTYEELCHEQGQASPRVCISETGVVHIVWRDAKGMVWHLECSDGRHWLRSGGTSRQPESIGTATATPAILSARHQLLVAMPVQSGQIEYSLYTGQSWEKNLPLTANDPRWKEDRLSSPQLLLDGNGVPWLFYANSTGRREYVYYTRWLGFGWDGIREGRGIFHVSDKFEDNLASVAGCVVQSHVARGSREFSILLSNGAMPNPHRAFRIASPAPIARAGTELLFLDMLDVGRSIWTEQVLQTAHKHPDNPILRPSGDVNTIDSHRVFNGGVVLRDEGIFKAWYGASNPEAEEWFKEIDGVPGWKRLLRLCYATSEDGIRWEKPSLGMHAFRGSKQNNAIGLGLELSSELRHFHGPFNVMRNPNPGDQSRKYLSVPPGFVSADGLHWRKQPVTFARPGPKPKWVDYHSVVYDPEAPASRRWKAYGCMCPNLVEPPVRRAICYAYSADGLAWTEHPQNPVFQAETSSHWDKVHDVAVCKYKGRYVMIYQTGAGYDQHLELAVSRDGEHFVRVHDGQAIIEQPRGDAFDRGLFLPTKPLVMDNEIRLYYSAADYQSPDDPPFEFKRWKQTKMQLGLATLPTDGWTYIRNVAGKHVGYVTTVPMKVENLENCVLTLNTQTGDNGYLLAELLDGSSDDVISGYELDHCDKVDTSGNQQVVSWKGKSGLGNVTTDTVRVRIIFRGKGDGLRLYSMAFRRSDKATPPDAFEPDERLVEESLVYPSSVSHLHRLKAWTAFRPDGKPKPVVVMMHGFGEPVLRHGGRRMLGTVRHYALRGLYAIAVDLRGREESAGQRDDGGLEVMDIYDAVQAAIRKHPQEIDASCINMTGGSGGGGNTFSAVTRMPDLFSNATAFFGITDYGHWANTSYKGALEPNIGGTPAQVPDRYAARNSLLGVVNNAYTRFHFFWDTEETICPPWMDTEYRRLAEELGYDNITAHESKPDDKVRWLHTGFDRTTAAEAERITMPPILERNNPAPKLAPSGKLMVLGYLMTKRFQALFGQGNDAVTQLDYELDEHEYRFAFQLKTSDPSVRGWLRITDRKAAEVTEVMQNEKPHDWTASPDGHLVIRDIAPTATLTVRFRRVE